MRWQPFFNEKWAQRAHFLKADRLLTGFEHVLNQRADISSLQSNWCVAGIAFTPLMALATTSRPFSRRGSHSLIIPAPTFGAPAAPVLWQANRKPQLLGVEAVTGLSQLQSFAVVSKACGSGTGSHGHQAGFEYCSCVKPSSLLFNKSVMV